MRNAEFRAILLAATFMLLPQVVSAQNLIGVQSRKVHGAAGPFQIAVDYAQPIGGLITIEPRAIGAGHSLVFQFDTTITAPGSATITDQFGTTIGTATTAALGTDNNVTVTLVGVPDNVRGEITLTGVNGVASAVARIGYLYGDVNGNRLVSSVDVSSVKAQASRTATALNFRNDLGASGVTTAADIAGIKSRLNKTFVAPDQASLSVNFSGTGVGSVTSSPTGINCPGSCSAPYVVNTLPTPPLNVTLNALASPSSLFTGWSGACSGNAPSVDVAMAGTRSCSASFAIKTYMVTSSSGANGSISPMSSQIVNHGSSVAFTLTPSSASYVGSVSGTCGGTLVGATFTTNPIVASCTVNASFNLVTYPVTPSAGANGVIAPNTVQNIANGSTTTFTVSPNANFTPTVSGTCGGTLSGLTYTTAPIVAPCTVSASFVRNSYTVTPSATANGTISPSSPQTVLNGNTRTFTVTPSSGYSASMGGTCGGTLTGTTFTTSPITGNCSVIASFISNAPKYVATTGNDSTGNGTIGNPWQTIAKGLSTLLGGETLIIRNGTYTGPSNFITGVPSGTATRFTTISAETPMQVRIQSSTTLAVSNNQLNLSGNFIKVDGFIFDMSGTINPAFIGEVNGNSNTVRRSIFKRSGDIDAFGGLLSVTGSDNLFEDVAGVGACAICFKQGGAATMTQRNIWRRVIGRFDYSNSTQQKATFATIGGSTAGNVKDHLYQNVIALDGQNPGNLGGSEKMGAFYAAQNTSNITLQGSAVINEGVGSAGMNLREFGSINNVTNSIVWDLQDSLPGAPGIVAGVGDKLTVGGTILGVAADLVTPATASLLKPAVNPANLVNNTPGAVLLKQYGVSGTRWSEAGFDQITAVDLWPWPFQDRIKSVFAEVNNTPAGNSPGVNNTLRGFAANGVGLYGGPITLSSYIWEYLGAPCPATACTVFTVTPSVGANGSITPSTPQVVGPGGTVSFTLSPDPGFVGSVAGTCGGTLTGNTYTTTAVNSSCTVAVTFVNTSALLNWDAVTSDPIANYRVYYGTAPGVYTQTLGQGINVGLFTTYTVTGLTRGARYYFAVTATNSLGIESGYSNEVFKDIP